MVKLLSIYILCMPLAFAQQARVKTNRPLPSTPIPGTVYSQADIDALAGFTIGMGEGGGRKSGNQSKVTYKNSNEMPLSCIAPADTAIPLDSRSPLSSSVVCNPVPGNNTVLNLNGDVSAINCNLPGELLQPFVYEDDRKVCECRNQRGIPAPRDLPSDIDLRKELFQSVIESYVTNVFTPIIRYRVLSGKRDFGAVAPELDIGSTNANLSLVGLAPTLNPTFQQQGMTCEFGSITRRLHDLINTPDRTASGCTSENCRMGIRIFSQALSDLYGITSMSSLIDEANLMSRLATNRVAGNSGLIRHQGKKTLSCLRNSYSIPLMARIPFGDSENSQIKISKAQSALRYLQSQKQNLGSCSESSNAQGEKILNLSENRQFREAMSLMFDVSPLSRRVFELRFPSTQRLEIEKNCLLALRLIDKSIEMQTRIVSLGIKKDESNLLKVTQALNQDVVGIESLVRDLVSSAAEQAILSQAQSECEKLKNSVAEMACANDVSALHPSLVKSTITSANFEQKCPGQSLESCQAGLACLQVSKNNFMLNSQISRLDLSTNNSDDSSGELVDSTASLCKGFEDYVKTHPDNPCTKGQNFDYESCMQTEVLGKDDVLSGFLATFSAQLISSSNPEERTRGLLLSQHSGREASSFDRALMDEAIHGGSQEFVAAVEGRATSLAIARLGPDASEKEIRREVMSLMQNEVKGMKEVSQQLMSSYQSSKSSEAVIAAKETLMSTPTQIQRPSVISSERTNFIQPMTAPKGSTPSPMVPVIAAASNIASISAPIENSDLRNQLSQTQTELSNMRRSLENFNSAQSNVSVSKPTSSNRKSKTIEPTPTQVNDTPVVVEGANERSSGFVSGARRRAPASVNSSAPQPQSQVQAQAFTPPAGSVVYNSVAEAVTSLDQARIQGGGQLKLRAAGSGAQTSRGGVPLDQILTVSVMDASNVEQVLEGIRAQFNSQILAENEVKFVEVRDGGKSTIYKVQKVNGELVIEEAVSPEEVASGVLIETSQRQPRVVRFTLSGLSSRLNEAFQRD